MQFYLTKIAALVATAGLLSACGGDSDRASGPPPSAKSTVTYAGRVTDQNGVVLPAISVRLENRSTDQTIEAVTEVDGSFSAAVETGAYDVIFDDQDAMNYTSLQLLAVDLQTDAKRDVQLASAQTLAHNLLSGTVTNTGGVAEAGRKLLILPSIAHAPAAAGSAEVPAPFFVQTDAQGHFSRSLGRAGMDFDFDALVLAPGAPELDTGPLAAGHVFASEDAETAYRQKLQNYVATYIEESVDIEKPDGAMHINLVLGSTVRNLRGAAGTPSVVPADARQLAEQQAAPSSTVASLQSIWTAIRKNTQGTLLGMIPSAQAAVLITKFKLFQPEFITYRKVFRFELFDGRIDADSTCKYVSLNEIRNFDSLPSSDAYPEWGNLTKLCLTKEPKSLFRAQKYSLHLMTSQNGNFDFRHEDQATTSLRAFALLPTSDKEYKVVLKNKQPSINNIYIRFY